MTERKTYHVIVAFKSPDRVTASAVADQLAIICQLGIPKPLKLWPNDGIWPDRPEVRIVFLTVRRGENGQDAISRPVGSEIAKTALARLANAVPHFEGLKESVHYVRQADDFGARLFYSDERTVRILRKISMLHISANFPDFLDPLDIDDIDNIESEPEPEPEPKRPDWPGIERPTRF